VISFLSSPYPHFDVRYPSQTPVLEDTRDVTIAQSAKLGVIVLISYEHKVRFRSFFSHETMLMISQAPPQLWRLDVTKDRDTPVTSRLALR